MINKNGSENQVAEYIKDEKAVISVYAEWCSTCEMMAPVLEELGKKDNGINVYKLDVDKNQKFVLENKVSGTPTHFLYKNGKLVKTMSGYVPVEEFEGAL